jgi:hypothetical protein
MIGMFKREAFGSILWLAVLLAAGCMSMQARAAKIAIGHAKAGTPYIGIVGDIEPGDDRKFIALATQMDSGPVILGSEGGSVVAAIKIGEAIRLKGYPTFVPETLPCNSACALVWLAGSPRMLDKSAKIGFHAGYVTTADADRESGAANAIIGRYLTLLGLSERAILFATLAPPNKLNFLDAGTLAASGIDAEIIDTATNGNPAEETATVSPPTPHPAPDTASAVMETSVLKRVGFWRIAIDHTLDNSCFAIGDWSSGTSLRIGINLQRQGRIFVMVGKRRYDRDRTFRGRKISLHRRRRYGAWLLGQPVRRRANRHFLCGGARRQPEHARPLEFAFRDRTLPAKPARAIRSFR